ncbi:hypothetical protein SAMN04489793_0418 [Tsukamurella tyrosinosolvens]|uniref:Uncharacterized protein n=1 Tax=Tsukamurella tyrosinosolvens TaxID=57704 RepID=A0A1H4L0U3_TSUTY|nr:hypothetical protein SAMN04489793_0418 [Tsukamurella tyrosinosolvens]
MPRGSRAPSNTRAPVPPERRHSPHPSTATTPPKPAMPDETACPTCVIGTWPAASRAAQAASAVGVQESGMRASHMVAAPRTNTPTSATRASFGIGRAARWASAAATTKAVPASRSVARKNWAFGCPTDPVSLT